jgi:hypothetical protein
MGNAELFPSGVKWAVREAGHSHPSTAEVKNVLHGAALNKLNPEATLPCHKPID